MRFRSTSWCSNTLGCYDAKSEAASTTVGSSPVPCTRSTAGWNTIGNSGKNAWMHWKFISREDARPQREEQRMEQTADGKHRMVVRRRMPAPREVVYQAWI